jgi:hypothetical protein
MKLLVMQSSPASRHEFIPLSRLINMPTEYVAYPLTSCQQYFTMISALQCGNSGKNEYSLYEKWDYSFTQF